VSQIAACDDHAAPSASSDASASGLDAQSGDASCTAVERDASTQACRAPSAALGDGVVGSACDADQDCGHGNCLKSIAVVNVPYPGGYCSGACKSDSDCGARGICTPGLRGAGGACYLTCTEADGCSREGYLCRVVSGVGRCIPGAEPLPDHVVGAACDDDAACGGSANTCASKLGQLVTPGGYCSQACAIDGDCGAGGKCINGISIPTVTSGLCFRACEELADCRTDYDCKSLSGTSGGPGVCVPNPESDGGL
jgi:hypothetical protein